MSTQHAMKKQIDNGSEGVVFNIQRYSVNDGPGIRTLIFFKGCPLACAWCSNPESQRRQRQIMYFENLCTRCGACVGVCPNSCVVVQDEKRIHNPDHCSVCGACEKVCPNDAVKLVGERMGVDEVLAIGEKDYLFYLNSGGGITLGGGEPTMQPAFADQLLRGFKSLGIHTAMETCGHADWSVFEQLNPNLDLLLYDLKHIDAATHRQGVGKSNSRILRNLERLLEGDVPLVVRIPVIPGFNADSDTIEKMAAFLDRHNRGAIERVDLLPYHKLGVGKYTALNYPYALAGEATPDEDVLDGFKRMFSDQGFDTIVEYL